MEDKVDQLQSKKENEVNHEGSKLERKMPKLLRINVDDYSTKHMVVFWLIYLGLTLAISLLTLALPPTFVTYSNQSMLIGTSLQGCRNPLGFNADNLVYCSSVDSNVFQFGILLRKLSNKNQFFSVYATFVPINKAQNIKEFGPIKINLKYYKIEEISSQNGITFKKIQQLQNQDLQFYFRNKDAQKIYQNNGYTPKGFRRFFGYQKFIQQENTLIIYSFQKWPIPNVQNIELEIVTVAPAFTIYSIVFRYILFAISVGTTIGYFVRYRTIPQEIRTIEQKMVLCLSIFTVMFNDPFYPATILAPNFVTATLSVVFIVNFVTFLILFWMVFLDRILYQSGQDYNNAFNKLKKGYMVLLFVSFFILEIQIAKLRFSDRPMIVENQIYSGGVLVFYIITILIISAGLIYIACQYIRSLINFFQKIWRNQMFLLFTFLFIVVIIVMIAINGFSVYDYQGNRILILFGFMNFYTFYLQYMYSINDAEARKLQNDRILGVPNLQGNEISTIVSNLGNEDIMVDLDSEKSDLPYYQNEIKGRPTRINKYEHSMLKSRDEIEQIGNSTEDNLGRKQEQQKKQQEYSIQD